MPAIDVRPAESADISELARTLAVAFHDDPVMSWVLPDPRRRAVALPRMFAAICRHHYLPGGAAEVARHSGRIVAGALWSAPGEWKTSPRQELRILPGLLLVMRGDALRGMRANEAVKAAHPTEPHWYLGVIGSDPQARGGGYGRALLQSRLERCDREFAPAHLESSNPDNVPYYQRFGFVVTGEIRLPAGGPTLWQMWREPA